MAPAGAPAIVLVADPCDPRVREIENAAAGAKLTLADVVPYTEIARDPRCLLDRIPEGGLLRIDSPGRSPEARAAIIDRGRLSVGDDALPALESAESLVLCRRKGLIVHMPQWYRGFASIMTDIDEVLSARHDVSCLSDPQDNAMLFDKSQSGALLRSAGVPKPEFLGNPRNYDELSALMRASGHSRVFVKLRYGSAASGVVALERSGNRVHAWTTTEFVREHGAIWLFNTRKIVRLRDEIEIAALIDALCKHEVHVERWVPKGGLLEQCYDIRQLVIAGEPAHGVARLSKTPITNLHLLNDRAPIETVQANLPTGKWKEIEETCRAVARLFPDNLQLALDIAISPCRRRHWVLEVNAFGDLLHGCLFNGRTTYEHEFTCLNAWRACHV